jgi:hypothetical protein
MSVLNKLTEGIVNRDLAKEGQALVSKWEKTGLLEGIDNEIGRNNMSVLLENQAKELLREASQMAAGDVEGFAAVAFPIVRRVFGGLIANQLVSVQPMSLPSGLIFFLDFTTTFTKGAAGAIADKSVYGGNVVGQEVTGGVSLTDDQSNDVLRQEQGFYNLNNGYASPTGSSHVNVTVVASGVAGVDGTNLVTSNPTTAVADYQNLGKMTRYDPDISGTVVVIGRIPKSDFTNFNQDNLISLHCTGGADSDGDLVDGTNSGKLVRRLSQIDPNDNTKYLVVFAATGSATAEGAFAGMTNDATAVAMANTIGGATTTATRVQGRTFTHTVGDPFAAASPTTDKLGAVVGTTPWVLENQTDIPEIDIKVDSVSVTAITKKLKAKWTPELAQDLNAYHNLDAEVELTSILSEQIALEIDREILEDLVKGATTTLYWSRRPGQFVNRTTGADIGGDLANESLLGADFTGTVSEWYETLIETVNDVSANIHRKTLRGGANFLVCSPEVANVLEFTAGFRASVTVDGDTGTAGAVKVGALSKKFDVYVDPYFPRNVILVGRKGNSFLESGYVYAPYVPLQVTPTIFGIEDFVPRKGVMTRYAKKMVRPDMYGLVLVKNLNG